MFSCLEGCDQQRETSKGTISKEIHLDAKKSKLSSDQTNAARELTERTTNELKEWVANKLAQNRKWSFASMKIWRIFPQQTVV